MSDLTEGRRIYAIGDMHGRLDLVSAMFDRIRRDLSRRPHPQPLVICLGDYMDRGPECRGVLEALMALRDSALPARFLLGNHDSYVSAYLRDPDWYDRTYHWLHDAMGGNATLASYGVPDASDLHPAATRDAFAAAFPAEHMAFLDACELGFQIGGYFFVHAGIRPGVALDAQERDDLIWIREPFLSSSADFGVKVVHGHTIVPEVEHHPNRIAVDTGGFRTGRLSCLLLEGEEVGLLTEAGPEPLPVNAGKPGWRTLWMRR
ncbi:MAG: metallophosphoesterase [Amaricoccus sp.]|uniref:metallophosphoesterase n=1 Tax=Amaricoccus sp. TaxID=1872485 RepID=UPI0039E4F295